MPCYDKKLEASRNDFYNDVYSTRDVDCVITTGELELLMKAKGWDLSLPVPGELDPPALLPPETPDISFEYLLPELMSHRGSSSGSYLQAIINHLILESPVPLNLELKQIRHEDYEETLLRQKDAKGQSEGEIVFSGAKCYGFRNLQNLVRKVGTQSGVRVGTGAAGKLSERRRQTPSANRRGYDYVEVMACPGGCVNGGGQLKPPNKLDPEGYLNTDHSPGDLSTRWANKDWTRKVEETYWQDSPTTNKNFTGQHLLSKENPSNTEHMSEEMLLAADKLMASILGNLCPTDEGLGDVDVCEERDLCRRRFFRTQYKAVESEVVGLAVKW